MIEKEIIQDQHLTGERALFQQRDKKILRCLFDDGESPLKESRNLEVEETTFGWKYPLWYNKDIDVLHSTFLVDAKSGIWYTDHARFYQVEIYAPKEFRRCDDLSLSKVNFYKAWETLWTCSHVTMKDVMVREGDYFGKDCSDLIIDHLDLEGNYCFDGGKRIRISNSRLISKDAFWNCEDILIENCEIDGEYFGWNSKNITLRNCIVRSHQGFCYIEGLTIRDSKIVESDLTFEYCKDIDAEVDSDLDSVKNPISGRIRAKSIKELILDDPSLDYSAVTFEMENER